MMGYWYYPYAQYAQAAQQAKSVPTVPQQSSYGYNDYQMSPRGTSREGYPTAYSYGTQMGNSWNYQQQQTAQQPQMTQYEQQYLSLLKGSIPNPLLNAGLSAGSALFGGIVGLLGGDSEQEKAIRERRTRGKEVYNLMKNRLSQSGNEPQQYFAQFMRATQEDRAREAEGVNQRLGLDSGVAQGEMLKNAWNSYLNYSLGAQERSRANKDNLLAMMAQLG